MAKSFKEQSGQDPDTVMIVDLLNLCFRFKHSKQHEFSEDLLDLINSLKRSYKASKVILACDKGSSSYRKGIYPEYKQNRKDKHAEQTDKEKAEFEEFFRGFEEALLFLETETSYPILRFQGVEADDIAAYLVERLYKTKKVWLISSDGDWDLLIKPNVSRFSYVTRKEMTLDNWYDKYEFAPEDYISVKCLTGDSGDNVKGIPGIGPKRAAQLVAEYGSALDLVAALPIQSRYKYIQAVNESEALIYLNYQLMDLVSFCQEAIGSDNISKIDQVIEDYINAS